jgi:hypothetical protein
MKTFNEFINENFDEDIEDDEEFFDDYSKIKNELNTIFGKGFGNDANWAGVVWPILTKNDYEGIFIYLGDDDELFLLKRTFDKIKEENNDEILFSVTNREEFDKLIKLAKDKEQIKMLQNAKKYNVI